MNKKVKYFSIILGSSLMTVGHQEQAKAQESKHARVSPAELTAFVTELSSDGILLQNTDGVFIDVEKLQNLKVSNGQGEKLKKFIEFLNSIVSDAETEVHIMPVNGMQLSTQGIIIPN